MIGHSARAERGEQGAPFGHVIVAVFAHHVEAHDLFHQPAGLHRGKHIYALFFAVDISAFGDQSRTQFGDICNGFCTPHFGQIGVGIGVKGGGVYVVYRSV